VYYCSRKGEGAVDGIASINRQVTGLEAQIGNRSKIGIGIGNLMI
jgi:hypothetical protein